jgi:3-oxoacyl-(acyl-carrier-protein) synthase
MQLLMRQVCRTRRTRKFPTAKDTIDTEVAFGIGQSKLEKMADVCRIAHYATTSALEDNKNYDHEYKQKPMPLMMSVIGTRIRGDGRNQAMDFGCLLKK